MLGNTPPQMGDEQDRAARRAARVLETTKYASLRNQRFHGVITGSVDNLLSCAGRIRVQSRWSRSQTSADPNSCRRRVATARVASPAGQGLGRRTRRDHVREGKGDKDRVTTMPRAVANTLQQHLQRVEAIHQKDVADGYGRVELGNS